MILSSITFSYCRKCHKINPNHGGSNIAVPDWIKNKKTTTNPINKRDKQMFSVRCNSRAKLLRNKKGSAKSNNY